MPVYKRVNKNFFKTWTPEMAYVLGFFCADGTITVNPRGSEYIAIQIADRGILEKMQCAMESEHRIATRKRPDGVQFRLQIGSKEMCNDLRTLGVVERKTRRLVVPDVPHHCLGHFVRGYFDGDGNVWKGYVHKERKTHLLVILTRFTSCSIGFLESLKKALEEHGISGSILRRKMGGNRQDVFLLQYSSKSSMLLYRLMYGNITSGLYLERKKKVYDGFIAVKLPHAAVVQPG